MKTGTDFGVETMGNFFQNAFDAIDDTKNLKRTTLVVQKQKATILWMEQKICDKFINQSQYERFLDCERLATKLMKAWNIQPSYMDTKIVVVPIWHRLKDSLDEALDNIINFNCKERKVLAAAFSLAAD